jgi:hypothetical protein
MEIIWWEGDIFKNFLDVAFKLGIKLIYFIEVVEEKDKHRGEIGHIAIGYIYSNTLHLFGLIEDWFGTEKDEIYLGAKN